ncbi:endonuclease/exonuclease/phosphatase family protein [Chryseobacterium sp. WG14]|uniref:endonuclease/exonuclease/phosphatase family protein n=1 Tax=Chryseobacterium sp. WG14 TaxID=2926909 RepID=UPI00211DA988|nr:endonuclease/exonuclease/phosphatase family protein [Chryseobacterium sp. WG14]MCQ9639708.1 endonuclease/exonuclease/phosphatase family protein [Chryseobacterium sp. WG14]
MKNKLCTAFYAILMLCFTSCTDSELGSASSSNTEDTSNAGNRQTSIGEYSFSIMQLNIWLEGTKVPNGYDAIVNEIAAREPDFVTLSEVGTNTNFNTRILASLKQKGKIYYSFNSNDTTVLSKYPIKEYSKFSRYDRIVTEIIAGNEIAVYSGHLHYKNYAAYYPRGYDPNTFTKLSTPITDPVTILQENDASNRPREIQDFITTSKNDIASGRTVILGGDFNEPSYLDWTNAAKNLYDHRGAVVPWSTTATLSKANFKDSYRVLYPNEIDYPGFTWPAQASWTPSSDERDRIDYIFYYDDSRTTVKDSYIVGPKNTVVKNISIPETSKDKFSEPVGAWPTDHKGVLTVFTAKIKDTALPKITLNNTSYKLNEDINITYTNGSTDPKAWIGIYKQGIIPGQNPSVNYSTKWGYTNGQTNGTLNFKLSTPGNYFVAYFKDNGYNEIAQRVYFTSNN